MGLNICKHPQCLKICSSQYCKYPRCWRDEMVTLLFKILKHIGLHVILQSYSEPSVFCIQICCKSNMKGYECECVKPSWIAAVEIAAIYHCLLLWGWNRQTACHIYCIYNAVLRSSPCADAPDRGTYKYRCVCCKVLNRFQIIIL